jgi:predicted DNA-binding protein with PD1-like motif
MTSGDESAVPPFHSAEAQPARVIVGRLLPGADLIHGLEAVCDRHGIKYASVTAAYGSLSSAAFKILQVRPETGPRAALALYEIGRRVEFLSGQGLVCDDGEGNRATHLHGAVADESGQVMGGHFEQGRNPVYNNMDFTITELLGVRLTRAWDPQTQTIEMIVEQADGGSL